MSMNVYVEELNLHTQEIVAYYQELMHNMENLMLAIDNFVAEESLTGSTYDSAKAYFDRTHKQIARGFVALADEMIRQTQELPERFEVEVSKADIVEDEIQQQLQQVDQLRLDISHLTNDVASMATLELTCDTIKRKLQKKLDDLSFFNYTTRNSYDYAIQLMQNIAVGLNEVTADTGFQNTTGTFSADAMDLHWSDSLNDLITH